MLLRLIGVLVLAGVAGGVVVAVLGLRRQPERIRELTFSSLFTVGGGLCVGFGLAFSFGFARMVLVVGGIAAYLYGFALGLVRRSARPPAEPDQDAGT